MLQTGPHHHSLLWQRIGVLAVSGALLAGIAYYTPDQAPPVGSSSLTEESIPSEDTEPPVIHGAQDLTVERGKSVSYRSGVHVTDNCDARVMLEIDASAVDLNTAGSYPVVYHAVDTSGNGSSATVMLTVINAVEDPHAEAPSLPTPAQDARLVVTQEMLDEVCSGILSRITTPEASPYERARAIFNYVYQHIKYVGSSDKSDWVRGAYIGLTRGKGDCFNYYAASRALLSAAGIDNLSLERVGGRTRHYWNLVNVGDGWYHFDACWHPSGYPNSGFMMTEAQARDYTKLLQDAGVRTNYYVYDYTACPVTVVGTPEELPAEELPPEDLPTDLPDSGALGDDGEAGTPLPEEPGETTGLPEAGEGNTDAPVGSEVSDEAVDEAAAGDEGSAGTDIGTPVGDESSAEADTGSIQAGTDPFPAGAETEEPIHAA